MNSGDQNYKEACSRYEKGDLSEAIELFTKAIDYYSKSKEDEKEIKAHYYRGCSYYRLGILCEKNQMFEESKENFEKAIKDFEEVYKKINESYPKKIKEIKEKFNDTFKKLNKLYEKINIHKETNEDIKKIQDNLEKLHENLEEITAHEKINEKNKKNLDETSGKLYEVHEKIYELFYNKLNEIKEEFDDALKSVEEISKKINELFSFDYYAGCTCYKLGMLYEKKRMSDKAHENFKNASISLETASKYGPHKENGKLWFYKSIANYKLDEYEDSFEDFKKAVTYDYYDIEIFRELLPEDLIPGDLQENSSMNILLLYYLKRYSDIIKNYSNDLAHEKCLDNIINDYGYEGTYYCALSHYEFKDFKSSFEILNKLISLSEVIKNCESFKNEIDKYKSKNRQLPENVSNKINEICNNIDSFIKDTNKEKSNCIPKFNEIKKSSEELIQELRSDKKWQYSYHELLKLINNIKEFCEKNEGIKTCPIFADKLVPNSWYYRGLILYELSNNFKNEKLLNAVFDGSDIVIFEDDDKKEFKEESKKFIKNRDGKNLNECISDEEKKTKFVKYLNDESQKAFKKALEKYNKLIESSQTFELYYDKALVLDELKRYKEAIESLDEFLKNNPRNAKAWLKKGTILFKIAVAEGKTDFEEPKSENEKEESSCEKEIKKIGAAKNSLEKSIGYFKILIDENPNNPDHWYNRGTAHSSLAEVLIKIRKYQDAIEEYEKAVTAFETATTLNPNFALAWNNKGNAYMKLKKYNKAIEAFEKAFEINPNYYLALHNKGDALYSLGKYEEAINIYDQVISTENDPNVYKSWNDRGLAKYRLENYEEALEAFDKAIEINPTFADGLINRGVVFYKSEMLSKAKEVFEKALELEPGNSRASNNLGVVLAREGELDRAKKLFENTIQEDPDFILAHANLAELFLNSGGIEEASKNIKSIQIDDKNPDSNIGYIHFLDGKIKIEDMEIKEKKYSDATKSFEKAASFNLDNPIFLLWSVYAKYLCQKFEINGESDSSEKSKPANENSQSKTEDIHSNELFNSIICDLEKVIPFCKKSEVTRDDLVKKINQDSRSKTILPICTIAALTITLILGIKILYPIFKFFGILELVRDQFYIALILLLLAILLNYQYRILKRLETKELKIEESMNEKKLTIQERVSLYLIQMGIIIFRLESVFSRIRLTLIRLTLKSTANSEDSKSETHNHGRLKRKTEIRAQLTKFNNYEKIEEYTLYLLGYFYFKLQDYTTAKEKLQECISLKPDPRTDKAARDLLDNIWKQKIKPPFWTYWFNSPVNTWRRRASGTFAIFGIFLILFVHVESPQPVAWKEYKLNDSGNFTPDQINIYPYIISYSPANNTTSNPVASEISNGDAKESILTPASMDIHLHYPANNTTSNLTGSSSNNNNTNNDNGNNNINNNTTLNILTPASVNIYLYYLTNNTTSNPEGSENSNNNTTLNILTPASVNIYPDRPDNYFDAILLLILILIFISPSVRIAETVKIILSKGDDVGINFGPIAAPPEFNFELSPSLMLDVIKRLDENL